MKEVLIICILFMLSVSLLAVDDSIFDKKRDVEQARDIEALETNFLQARSRIDQILDQLSAHKTALQARADTVAADSVNVNVLNVKLAGAVTLLNNLKNKAQTIRNQ